MLQSFSGSYTTKFKISKVFWRKIVIFASPAKHGRHIGIMAAAAASSALSHFGFPIDNS